MITEYIQILVTVVLTKTLMRLQISKFFFLLVMFMTVFLYYWLPLMFLLHKLFVCFWEMFNEDFWQLQNDFTQKMQCFDTSILTHRDSSQPPLRSSSRQIWLVRRSRSSCPISRYWRSFPVRSGSRAALSRCCGWEAARSASLFGRTEIQPEVKQESF